MPRKPSGPACPCGCGIAPAPGTKNRPLACTVCGFTLRTTRQWLQRMPAVPACPVCQATMEAPCLFDALELGEDVAREHPSYARTLMGFTPDQVIREARAGQGGSDRLRCGGGCGRIVARVDAVCGCGFVNDIRGGRNYGHHGEGLAWCAESRRELAMSGRDVMPF